MGKYDDIKMDSYDLRVINPTFLKRIANELAEANRLKRYELQRKYGDIDLIDGLKEWKPDEELEDQA
jgi:hypothetical protein